MCLLAISVSFCRSVYVFCPFFVFFFFILSCMSCLYVFKINSFLVELFANIFSQTKISDKISDPVINRTTRRC